MVLNAGLLNVEQLIAGDTAGSKFTQIAVGTSNSPVTGTETALTGQLAKNITSFNYLGNGLIVFNATLASTDPAMVIQEIGLLNSAGVLCYRQVISPVNKVAGVTYALGYQIKVQ